MSVEAPSLKYGGKLEGLCGNCNGDDDDDLRTPEGKITTDVQEFGLSWLYDDIPGGQSKEKCVNQPEKKCEEVPVESDPCIQLEDVTKYGQVWLILNKKVKTLVSLF